MVPAWSILPTALCTVRVSTLVQEVNREWIHADANNGAYIAACFSVDAHKLPPFVYQPTEFLRASSTRSVACALDPCLDDKAP